MVPNTEIIWPLVHKYGANNPYILLPLYNAVKDANDCMEWCRKESWCKGVTFYDKADNVEFPK